MLRLVVTFFPKLPPTTDRDAPAAAKALGAALAATRLLLIIDNMFILCLSMLFYACDLWDTGRFGRSSQESRASQEGPQIASARARISLSQRILHARVPPVVLVPTFIGKPKEKVHHRCSRRPPPRGASARSTLLYLSIRTLEGPRVEGHCRSLRTHNRNDNHHGGRRRTR